MLEVNGSNISLLARETLPISVTVMADTNTEATDISVAKFKMTDGKTVIAKDCTINGAVVSVEFSEAETLALYGDYDYEIRVKSEESDVDSVQTGIISIGKGRFDEPL